MKYLSLILLLSCWSCVYDPPMSRLEINGYTCGDSIDEGIKITEIKNSLISHGVINEYENAEVWLFNNHIEKIIIDSITKNESKSLKEKITKIYNLDPLYFKDTLASSLIMKAEEYYWFDSVSLDRISILTGREDNTDSLSILYFENLYVANQYREYLYGPSMLVDTAKPMKFKR